MVQTRKDWVRKLEAQRNSQLLGLVEFAKLLGVQYITYKKFIDPTMPSLSLSTLRKMRDYVENLEGN
jgi:hypothetical protein